jgi:ASC-1-like (ASCH) protein
VAKFRNRPPNSLDRLGKVMGVEDNEVRLEVAKEKLQDVLQEILKNAEIEGLFVEELSLEDALKEVFEGIQNEKAQ